MYKPTVITSNANSFVRVGIVDSHVCILQERFDPLSRGKFWAMSRTKLCLCQAVVAPQTSGSQSCHRHDRRSDTNTLDDFWITDDPTRINLLTNRRNWTPEMLDHFLGRSHCCKFRLLKYVSVYFFTLFHYH